MRIRVQYDDIIKEHELDNTEILIGRGKDCDLRVNVDGVSRNHAKIYYLNDKLMIEDLNSANGIFINQQKVTKQELTTFFPIFLGPTVKIQLLDEKKQSSSTSTFANLKNYFQKQTTEVKPQKKEKISEKKRFKKIDEEEQKNPVFFALLTFFGLITFTAIFYKVAYTENKTVKSAVETFQPQPFEFEKNCSSPLGDCAKLRLNPSKKENLKYTKDNSLIITRNIAYPFRFFSSHIYKLAPKEKAIEIALETFLRTPVYVGFNKSDSIKQIVVLVYDFSNETPERIVTLEVNKIPGEKAPGVNRKLARRIIRNSETRLVKKELTRWYYLDFY